MNINYNSNQQSPMANAGLIYCINRIEDEALRKRLFEYLIIINREWLWEYNHSKEYYEAGKVIDDFCWKHRC